MRSNEAVNFHQPSRESVTLNRVIGNEKSVIEGAINAKGNVFISNPNGVLIGKGAQVNVGGLVATTQQISNDDFMQGNYHFNGASGGKIENFGNITVPKGGVVALIAPKVVNNGKINAPQGKVVLASAEEFVLKLPKDNFDYVVKRGTLEGLVDNGGVILAEGGRVVLTAKGLSAVKKSIINHSGVIEANTVQNKNGVVELLGDLDHSKLTVSGKISAEAPNGGNGGFVETSAADVKIKDSAKVSTQAKKGKSGKWLIDPNDFTIGANGDMSASTLSENLNRGDVEIRSTSGSAAGKGDVIVNEAVNWNSNTLTLNAQNDILINQNLTGTGSAKLALLYGQASDDGGESDYHFQKSLPANQRTAHIDLPEGKTLTLKKGTIGSGLRFNVIHQMPESGVFSKTDRYIALGRNIDLSNFSDKADFAGFELSGKTRLDGLGHTLSNLNLHITNEKIHKAATFLSFST